MHGIVQYKKKKKKDGTDTFLIEQAINLRNDDKSSIDVPFSSIGNQIRPFLCAISVFRSILLLLLRYYLFNLKLIQFPTLNLIEWIYMLFEQFFIRSSSKFSIR